MLFHLRRLRFHLTAEQPIQFPAGLPANILRGALGTVLHNHPLFRPKAAGAHPSGLSDPPRPFVFRAAQLDGKRIASGESFAFDIHLFDKSAQDTITDAFVEIGGQGLGPTRGLAVLHRVESEDICVPLDPLDAACDQIEIAFETPTELKAGGQIVTSPSFAVLMARIRDRLSALAALYGSGPLPLSHETFLEAAQPVQLVCADLTHKSLARFSTRTRQHHPLGGFVGVVQYKGALRPYVPFLRAAEFAGVGRQTTWGKGQIRIVRIA